ncbi:MAG TPA: calcium/sodium antiporter [Pyrinomonadaceae bacterium]|nr:calcium/sodium antiporter [Pyrinomonadaceae bacterium]HNU07785.1 calcium/sodium antiporter [Pyrinomonadaceae bacterium]
MLISLVFVILGLGLLAIGAESLVRGSSSVALRLGVTPLVVGLTIVAFGTGAPEFAISIGAALDGNGPLALGNVVGSNISNVCLILGLAAVVRPLKARSEVVRRETPVMVFITIVFLILLYDGELSRIDGLLMTVGAIAYTFLTYRLSRRSRDPKVAEEFTEALEDGKRPVWKDSLLIVAGLGLLVLGANLLLRGAVDFARLLEVSEAVIGLSVVAIGTSLPELATSVIAARKNEPDVALGNAIGSNALNVLAVLGVAAMINPIPTDGIRSLDLAVMLGSAVVLGVLLGRRFELDRLEGAILLIGYFVYIYTMFP